MLTAKLTKNQITAIICLALALVTTALYMPISHHDFVNFDDDDYITNNSHVQAGLTWAGTIWAFQTGAAANWHPLTWLSHMLDCQLYGLNPGGHHSTNLLFHIANTLLLFLLLRQLTGLRPDTRAGASSRSWSFVVQRVCGGFIRLASIARRIGGVGG